MAENIVWAASLRTPLPKWGFPTGHACEVKEIDGPLRRLVLDAQANPTDEKYLRIFALICPDATEEDWASSTDEDKFNLLLHAGSKLEHVQRLIEERRKNGLAGMIALADHTRHLSPTTTSATSAPESPSATPAPAATGTSSVPPTGKRSSRSTRSKKSNASTGSSPTLMP